jgi:vitamin B12 transporter
MKHPSLPLLALMAAIPGPALAQDILLEGIVVSASLEETEASRTGATIDVVTEDDLKQAGNIRGTDILARLPGVSIRTTGPLGTTAGVTIRGVPQNNIAVRVDGIDVSDPSGTQVAFNFGQFTTPGVSRIEVLKGSQSALYGSEAIGGAINITTRRATAIGTEQDVALEYGSYATVRASYGLATRAENHDLALTLSHIQSNGFSAADENAGNDEADGYEATRLSFAGGYSFANGLRASLAGFVERSWVEYDENLNNVTVDGTPDEQEAGTTRGLRTTLEFSTGGIDHTLDYVFFDRDRSMTGSNSFGLFRFDYVGRRNTLGYRGAADVFPGGRLVFGVETVTETYHDRIHGDYGSTQTHDSRTDSAYAEYRLAATEDIDVSAALRYDDHSRFGSFTTGRLSAVWRATPTLSLKANLANGFRAPSNYELYDSYAGADTLGPENSLSFDMGIERQFDGGELSVTYFDVRTEDLIDYSFTDNIYVQRDGTVRLQGIEVAGSWTVSNGVELGANYTYTGRSSDVTLDSSSWTAATPRHMVGLSVVAPLSATVSGGLAAKLAMDREDMGDYAVVDATLTKTFAAGGEGYLRVENLLDEEYQLAPGYGTSDRAFYVGLRKSF